MAGEEITEQMKREVAMGYQVGIVRNLTHRVESMKSQLRHLKFLLGSANQRLTAIHQGSEVIINQTFEEFVSGQEANTDA